MAAAGTVSLKCYWKGATSCEMPTQQDGSKVLKEARTVNLVFQGSRNNICADVPQTPDSPDCLTRLVFKTHQRVQSETMTSGVLIPTSSQSLSLTMQKVREFSITIDIFEQDVPSAPVPSGSIAQAHDVKRTEASVQLQMPEALTAGCEYSLVISSTKHGQDMLFTASLAEATTAASSTVEATTASLAGLTIQDSSTAEATQASASAAPPTMSTSTHSTDDLTGLSIKELKSRLAVKQRELGKHAVVIRGAKLLASTDSNRASQLASKALQLSAELTRISAEIARRQDKEWTAEQKATITSTSTGVVASVAKLRQTLGKS